MIIFIQICFSLSDSVLRNLYVTELGRGYAQFPTDLLDVALVVRVAVVNPNEGSILAGLFLLDHRPAGAYVDRMVGLDVVRGDEMNFLHGFRLT